MPSKAPVRPQNISLGDVTLRPVRGPHKRDPLLWYWRARGPRKLELGCRWATEGDAARWAAELVLGATAKPDEAPCDRVVDLLEMYLHYQVHQRSDIEERTRESTQTTVKRLVREDRGLRTVQVKRLDRGALDVYVRSAQAQGQAPNTTRLDLRILKAAWAWGRREGLAPDQRLDVPKVKAKRKTSAFTPSPAQVLEVLACLEGRPRVLLELQAELGARISEVAALRASDLRWPERWDLLRQAGEQPGDGWVRLGAHARARKTGARTVPLSAQGFALIEGFGLTSSDSQAALHGVDRPLFEGSQKWARESARLALRAAVADCGQPPWTSHALRRAAVRRLIGTGQDPSTAARLLGHSTQIMLKVYDQPEEGDLLHAARAARLDNVVRLQQRAEEELCP